MERKSMGPMGRRKAAAILVFSIVVVTLFGFFKALALAFLAINSDPAGIFALVTLAYDAFAGAVAIRLLKGHWGRPNILLAVAGAMLLIAAGLVGLR